MPVIGSLDPATKRIYLATGVITYHPVDDIYQEIRALRRTDESLRKYEVMVTAAGNVPKGGGKFTPRYIVMQNGWRIVPEDVSHVLDITGEQLTAEGGSGSACMDLTPLSSTSKVVINYAPPAAEVIQVDTGGTFSDADREKLTMLLKIGKNRMEVDIAAQQLVLYDDNGTTVIQRWNLYCSSGEALVEIRGVQAKRSAPLL